MKGASDEPKGGVAGDEVVDIDGDGASIGVG